MIERWFFGGGKKIDTWKIRVNTAATTSGNTVTGIPINLAETPGVTLSVDWGDRTSSILRSTDYTPNDATASLHTYAQAGEYLIQMRSSQWKKVYLHVRDTDQTGSAIPHTSVRNIWYFERTLIGIESPIPRVAGARDKTTAVASDDATIMPNSLENLFRYCNKITSLPENLFWKNPEITSFYGTFRRCQALTLLPAKLFSKSPKVRHFGQCFALSRFNSIPEGLFDGCPLIEKFNLTFYSNTNLVSVPSTLFRNNKLVTDYTQTFNNNSKYKAFELYIYSPYVSYVNDFCTGTSGTGSTIYVPTNSLTQTAFEAIASTRKFTVSTFNPEAAT